MTSIVGIACEDGVVIGSDSSATFSFGRGRPGEATIEQPMDKITIIKECIIVAGTGSVGYGQRFCDVICNKVANKHMNLGAWDIARKMSKEAIDDLADTGGVKERFGALVAFPTGHGGPHLFEFGTVDFQPELKDEKMWYASMGSAQLITDPVLGFIRHVFWKDGRPKLEDAKFAVTWVLEQAIMLNPGGVNGPMKLAVLEKKKGEHHYTARILPEAELQQHQQLVADSIQHLREFPNKLTRAGAPEPPSPPAPSTDAKSGPGPAVSAGEKA